jgi:hypothetical protein
VNLDKQCECGHALRQHNKATPNHDLVTCAACDPKLCLVHLGFQPAEVVNALTGIVTKPTLALVGADGPEVVTPLP